MRIIGCDLHAAQQTIAMLDRETGEIVERTPRAVISAAPPYMRTVMSSERITSWLSMSDLIRPRNAALSLLVPSLPMMVQSSAMNRPIASGSF